MDYEVQNFGLLFCRLYFGIERKFNSNFPYFSDFLPIPYSWNDATSTDCSYEVTYSSRSTTQLDQYYTHAAVWMNRFEEIHHAMQLLGDSPKTFDTVWYCLPLTEKSPKFGMFQKIKTLLRARAIVLRTCFFSLASEAFSDDKSRTTTQNSFFNVFIIGSPHRSINSPVFRLNDSSLKMETILRITIDDPLD